MGSHTAATGPGAGGGGGPSFSDESADPSFAAVGGIGATAVFGLLISVRDSFDDDAEVHGPVPFGMNIGGEGAGRGVGADWFIG